MGIILIGTEIPVPERTGERRHRKMKRVYCLYRVSTAQQVDVVKDDIPMQRIACHDFAARMGWTILVEKEEKGISGFKVPLLEEYLPFLRSFSLF